MRRPQNFAKSSPYFWLHVQYSEVRWRFCKILWPSQKIWTLKKLKIHSKLDINQSKLTLCSCHSGDISYLRTDYIVCSIHRTYLLSISDIFTFPHTFVIISSPFPTKRKSLKVTHYSSYMFNHKIWEVRELNSTKKSNDFTSHVTHSMG